MPAAVGALRETLAANGADYVLGKTWTTDAFYRETPGKIARRREEGCVTVEMEAAAFFAVAQFRGVPLAQLLADVALQPVPGQQARNVVDDLLLARREAFLAEQFAGKLDVVLEKVMGTFMEKRA